MTPRLAHAQLHPGALRHNLRVARTAAPTARVMACIKAEGYGHGLAFVARTVAAEADSLAIACVGEGVALREAGFTDHPICVLNGPADRGELAAAREWRLEPVIHQPWQVAALAELPPPADLPVWLKINSGMGRIGIPPAEAKSWHARLQASPAVAATGLMTHMACADDRSDDYTHRQYATFEQAGAGLSGPRSVANSACVLGWPDTHGDVVRPGIMLYGCSPFVEGAESALGLEPAMTLRAPLIGINQMTRGDFVGYGCTWQVPEDMPVGVVGIGYGDGYPRGIHNGTPALLRGQRVPIVGRVSMDKITIDLRGVDAAVGDDVTLWGRGLPVEEIATATGTIGYELLCGVHGRVPMTVTD